LAFRVVVLESRWLVIENRADGEDPPEAVAVRFQLPPAPFAFSPERVAIPYGSVTTAVELPPPGKSPPAPVDGPENATVVFGTGTPSWSVTRTLKSPS